MLRAGHETGFADWSFYETIQRYTNSQEMKNGVGKIWIKFEFDSLLHFVGPDANLLSIDGTFYAAVFVFIHQIKQ